MSASAASKNDMKVAREYARRLKKRLGDNLLSVTLFGSRARGTAREGSDFDLIVRVKSRADDTREAVLDVNVDMMDEFEMLFMGMLYDEKEWSRAKRFPLGWNVDREGIAL